VVKEDFEFMTGYATYINIGTNRGTAILTTDTLELILTEKLPNGRGIAAMYDQTFLVNVHAPSGCVNRKEREMFSTT
jgi:exonuclease III